MDNKRSKLIYTAGAYTGLSFADVARNIHYAREEAVKIWELGYTAICPHLNTEHFEVDCKCDYEDYMMGDFEIIRRCDAIYMIPRWIKSSGANREKMFATQLGLPVFYNLEYLAAWRF